jgi:hypothetical protein
MLLGFETWRVNQSYAVDLQLRLLLQRGVAVRYVALVIIIAAVLSSFRMYVPPFQRLPYRHCLARLWSCRCRLEYCVSVRKEGASQTLSKENVTRN